MYLIRSKQPRLLKENHFEDLVANVNLLISMSNYSNTFWQALFLDIPCISIAFNDKETFMSKYLNYEVTLDKLYDAYNYHINESESKQYQLNKNEIKKVVFGEEKNSYKKIYDELENLNNVKPN